MASYYQPNSFSQEGIDHINISAQSLSHLGKLLDPSYFKTINYPYIGKFNSVLNLWYWLKSDSLDDRLRKYTGNRLKSILSTSDTYSSVPNFKAIIAYATFLKLKDYPGSFKELKSLPESTQFVSYYTPKGTAIRLCSNYAPIVIDIANLLREFALSDLKEPCLDQWVSQGQDGLNYLEPFLVSRLGQDKVNKMLQSV